MKIIAHLLLFFFIIVFSYQNVLACTCGEYYVPECGKIARSDAVFVGKIEKLFYITETKDEKTIFTQTDAVKHSVGGNFVARFTVIDVYKGELGKTIDVHSYIGTSCTGNDSNMKVGDKWTIYANFDNENKQWNTGIGACSYSFKGNKNSFLQDFKANKIKETVEGRILKDASWGDGIGDIPVKIEGEGFTDSSITQTSKKWYLGEGGAFKFTVPNAGKYKVSFVMPSGLAVLNPYGISIKTFPTEKETLVEYFADVPKGLCDFGQFETYAIDLKANATISGNFTSLENKQISNFYPQLCKIAESEEKTLSYSNCKTIYDLPPDGKYEFKGLREGKYVIVVNRNDFPDLNMPFFRQYFPGVRNFSDAQIITLEQGQQLALPDFKLPLSMPLTEIKGRLFWEKGVPVTKESLSENGVYFTFSSGNNPKDSLSMSNGLSTGETANGITLNDDGTFTFQVFQGMKYLISFGADNKKGKEFIKKIEIMIDDKLQPLEIILERVKN